MIFTPIYAQKSSRKPRNHKSAKTHLWTSNLSPLPFDKIKIFFLNYIQNHLDHKKAHVEERRNLTHPSKISSLRENESGRRKRGFGSFEFLTCNGEKEKHLKNLVLPSGKLRICKPRWAKSNFSCSLYWAEFLFLFSFNFILFLAHERF